MQVLMGRIRGREQKFSLKPKKENERKITINERKIIRTTCMKPMHNRIMK